LIGRRLLVVALTLLLAIQVVRSAAVAQFAPFQPATAASVWARHPQVEISAGMSDIARSVQRRADVGQATFAIIDDAAIKSPLSPEPFLVHGVQAQIAGNDEAARRAFVQAQWRDPRSVPAAYFLAEYNLRNGHLLDGLKQTALLARLLPQTTGALAPFLAAYARNRSTWPQIRALFRSEKGLQDAVLTALAQDPRNADAILALADADHRRPDSAWLPGLLRNLAANGDYARARAIWSSIGRAQPGPHLLYDADFSAPEAPPPFNWNLVSSTVGLAERQLGKKLHVLFYGNQDGVLASQLLTLSPGTYRLQMQIVGSPAHPEELGWSVRCDKPNQPNASVGIIEAAARGWTFQIPPDCAAQWIELSGRSEDVAQQSDVTIGGLALTRVGPNAE
jgi:hypothetical protein